MLTASAALRVLRIAHSDVVAAWRERARAVRRRGIDVRVVTSSAWEEGGRLVNFEPGSDNFVQAVRTFGRHPNLFLLDPRPLWQLLGASWDLLDIHEEPCSLVAAEILFLRWLRRARMPYLLYSAQNIPKHYPPPFRWIERVALGGAAAVSVCNHAAGRIARSKGLRGDIAEVPLGVDLARFAPADRQPPTSSALRIGYVGRLAAHKGVGVLIDSLGEHPHWALHVVGGGPDEQPLRDRVDSLALDRQVTWHGSIAEEALPDFYRSLDVVVVPSVPTPRWEEQFCRVAVEAMASGVPVVASRSGALPEVVDDAGVLVTPGEPIALAHALDALGADPERWSALRTAGLARAQRFTWEVVGEAYDALYNRVASPPPPHRKPPQNVVGRPLEVIVVAYGPPDLLHDCLAALEGAYRPIVVDNSGLPATREVVEQAGGTYINPGANLGFAGGVNRALREAHEAAADVLLLNPDAVMSAEAIAQLHGRLVAEPSVACAAPAQVNPDTGRAARVGWPFPSPSGAWVEALGFGASRKKSEFLIGSVLLLRSEAIADVGWLDERYFLYAEETDWQRRATRRGWRILYCPEIVATHIGAGTGGNQARRETYFHASHERYIRKYFGGLGWQAYRAAVISGGAVRILATSGESRARSALRLRLFLRGPVSAERRLPR